MKARAKTVLGIDLSEQHVSVALLESDERGLRIVAAATHEVPAGGQEAPARARAKVLFHTLRQLGRRARRRGIRAVLACTPHPMILQLVEVPEQVPSNLGEFVDQELKQCVALSGKEVRSDFCGTGVRSDRRRRLLMVAADVAQIRAQVRTCRRAGLAVETVEPVLLACARTFLRGEGQARYRRDILIAVLGPEHLALCLFSKGMLDFVRIREIPGDANALEPLCQWLAQELRAVRQYEEMKNSEENRESVMKLVVHDSGHPPQEVERLLAAQMGRERLTVVGTCHIPGVPAACEKPASMAAVGAALGLLETRPDEPGINLLPEEVTRARRFSRHLLVTANAAALVFLALLLLIQFVARATAAAREKIEQTRVSNQLAVTPALVAQERLLEQEISRVQEQRQRLQVVHPRQDVDWPGVLKAVRAVAPAGVCITDLSCSDSRSLALRGMALSGAAAREFVRGLEGGRVFESVVLVRLERQQDSAGLMQYQIDCLLKPAP